MSDVGLFIINNCVSLKFENGDLVGDNGLETAVLISLFSDARATDDQIPADETDPRGWWGDIYPNFPGDEIGSLLWITARGKASNETLKISEDFSVKALQWLIDDGIAASVTVSASYDDNKSLILGIEILRKTGSDVAFNYVWDGQDLARA